MPQTSETSGQSNAPDQDLRGAHGAMLAALQRHLARQTRQWVYEWVGPYLVPDNTNLSLVQPGWNQQSQRVWVVVTGRRVILATQCPSWTVAAFATDDRQIKHKVTQLGDVFAYETGPAAAPLTTFFKAEDAPLVIDALCLALSGPNHMNLEIQGRRGVSEVDRARAIESLGYIDGSAIAAAATARYKARIGHELTSDRFAGRKITIYSNGYIKLESFLRGEAGTIEKLISIEDSAEVNKKTALGRGAAGVVTFGVSALASSNRGDAWLTIVTDKTTRTLKVEGPRSFDLRAAKSLAAAGRAAIANSAPTEAATPQPKQQPVSTNPVRATVADRLRELEDLLKQGLIADSEYQALRQEILKSV